MQVQVNAKKVKVKTGLMGQIHSGRGVHLASGQVTGDIAPTDDHFSHNLPSLINDFYSNAVIVFTSGGLTGVTSQVVISPAKVVSPPQDGVIWVNQPGYEAWNTLPAVPAIGDKFSLYAGGTMHSMELMNQYLYAIMETVAAGLISQGTTDFNATAKSSLHIASASVLDGVWFSVVEGSAGADDSNGLPQNPSSVLADVRIAAVARVGARFRGQADEVLELAGNCGQEGKRRLVDVRRGARP